MEGTDGYPADWVMGTEVYEDTLDWECGTLELRPVETIAPPYPYPGLTPTGRTQPTSLRIVHLENDLIQATFARDLGGRLLQVLDKRTGRKSLTSPAVIQPRPGTARGAFLPDGMQWSTSSGLRPNAMGPVDFRPEPADTDDDPAGALFFELEAGTDLSLQVRWRLAPDRAVLQADVRIQNRGLVPTPYAGGFTLGGAGRTLLAVEQGWALHDPVSDGGIAVLAPAGTWAAHWAEPDRWGWCRRPEGPDGWLAPLDSDRMTLVVVPYSGIGSPAAVTDTAALGLDDGTLRLQLTRELEGTRMFVLTAAEQTLEAPGPTAPTEPVAIPLQGDLVQPRGFVLRDAEGQARLSWPVTATGLPAPDPGQAPPASARASAWKQALTAWRNGDDAMPALAQAEADPALRGPSQVVLALIALRAGNPTAALGHLDDALLRLGDDPLVWWLRAVAARQAGGVAEGEERPDLLNAHFLSPLEPALRAEGFLAQSPLQGREPNALVRPLAGHPDALADVACRLLDAGLNEDAARWIDEALRHGEAPNLRYLLAASLVENTRMRTEAAQHVAAAAQADWGPPFPWRAAEVHAVAVLNAAFPHDQRLARLAHLLQTRTG